MLVREGKAGEFHSLLAVTERDGGTHIEITKSRTGSHGGLEGLEALFCGGEILSHGVSGQSGQPGQQPRMGLRSSNQCQVSDSDSVRGTEIKTVEDTHADVIGGIVWQKGQEAVAEEVRRFLVVRPSDQVQ